MKLLNSLIILLLVINIYNCQDKICATIYSECDFQGISLQICEGEPLPEFEVTDFAHIPIKSVEVPEGKVLTLYCNPYYSGFEIKFDKTYRCVRDQFPVCQNPDDDSEEIEDSNENDNLIKVPINTKEFGYMEVEFYVLPIYHYQNFDLNDNYYSTDFYEIFYGLYGYSLIDFQGYILDQSSEYIETIPLYRYYSSELNRNFYTTDLTELDNEFFSSFTFDNIQGYVFTEEFEGVVPLYRFVDRENHQFFYTLNKEEVENQIGNYEFDIIIGYVFPKEALPFRTPDIYGNLIEVYRYYNSDIHDHFLTNDFQEIDDKSGYTYEGIFGYFFNVPVNETVPLYRYYNQELHDHYYTIDWDELQFGFKGYQIEGILGFIYPYEFEDATPIYKYFDEINNDHFYTMDENEQPEGYTYLGIDGYAYPPAQDQQEDNFEYINYDVTPLYKYYNDYSYNYFYSSDYFEFFRGLYGYYYQGIEGWILYEESLEEETIGLYRYLNKGKNKYYYTTDWNEYQDGNEEYEFQNIVGYIFSSESDGVVPLYKYYNADYDDYLYTINQEAVSEDSGYIFQEIIGYVFPSDALELTIPEFEVYPSSIYQFYNFENEDFLLTDDYFEVDLQNSDYQYFGKFGYIFFLPIQNTFPLYRYNSIEKQRHFYTTRWEEFFYGADDYEFEYILGFVYLNQVEGSVPVIRLYNQEKDMYYYTINETEQIEGFVSQGIQWFMLPPGNEENFDDGLQQEDESDKQIFDDDDDDEEEEDEDNYDFETEDTDEDENQQEIQDQLDQNNIYQEDQLDYFEVQFQVYPLYRYFNLDVNDHFFTTDFTEFYLGVYGYISEDFEGYILSAPSDDFETDQLLRYYNKDLHDHFYTTDPSEVQQVSFVGYNFEKVEGYVFKEPNDGLVPLYRFYNKDLHDHTLSLREDEFTLDQGYELEKIVGYVFSKEALEFQQQEILGFMTYIYRYYNTYIYDYILTSLPLDELGDQGYRKDGVLALFYSAPQDGSQPFYEYYNQQTKKHYYTINWSEYQFGKDGYEIQGIVGYVFLDQNEELTQIMKYYNSEENSYYYGCTQEQEQIDGYQYISSEGYAFYYDENEDYQDNNEEFDFYSITLQVTPFYRYFNQHDGDHFLSTNYFVYFNGQQGYSLEGFEGWMLLDPNDEINTVALYQYYSHNFKHHYYTTNFDEYGSGNQDYELIQIEGYVFNEESEGLVPLYEFYSQELQDYLYSQNEKEVENDQRYQMTRIVCYLFSKDALELIYPKITDYPTPIFRYYNSEIEDRILTLSFDEQEYQEYEFDNIIGYGYYYPIENTYPLYGYYNLDTGIHYYTTNWEEYFDSSSQFEFYEVVCYVYLEQFEGLVSVFRYKNDFGNDYLYISDENENLKSYSAEDIAFYVYPYYEDYIYEDDEENEDYLYEENEDYLYEVSFIILPLYRYYNQDVNDHFYTTDYTELYQGLYGFNNQDFEGYILESPSEDFDTVPLHRYFHPDLHDHFYTVDQEEVNSIYFTGYLYEGIQGYIFVDENDDLVPLHRFYNQDKHDHTLSLNKDEFTEENGYVYEGIVGYVFSKDSLIFYFPEIYGQQIIIYRFYNEFIYDYLLSNSFDDIEEKNDYTLQNIFGLLYDAPQDGTKPLYKYYNSQIQRHYYSIDWYEYQFGKDGFELEGVLGYFYDIEQYDVSPIHKLYNSERNTYYFVCQDEIPEIENFEYQSIIGYGYAYQEEDEDFQAEGDVEYQEVLVFVRPLYSYYNEFDHDHFITNDYTKYFDGQQGYDFLGSEGWIIVEPSDQIETFPLYRYYNSELKHHFYTTDYELYGEGNGQYQFEQIEGYVFLEQFGKLVPLYEFYNSEIADLLYTYDRNQVDEFSGYEFQRVVCYIISKDAAEMIYPEISAYPTPIFRYHNDEIGDHLLTIDFYQYGNSKNGYDYERAIGYGYVYPVYDSKPLYGYFNQEYQMHYFTTNWDKYHRQQDGYAFTEVICYVYLEEDEDLVPVLVYKSSETHDYLYTSDENELLDNYAPEQVEFYVYPYEYEEYAFDDVVEEDNESGYYEVTFSVYPLYKYYNQDVNDHLLTSDFFEMYMGLYGFNIEGIEAFILNETSEEFQTAPLFRYFNKELHDHFYTVDENEIAAGDYSGYEFERIEGYIFTEENEGLLPLYRYFNQNLNDHVITQEQDKYTEEEGYVLEKIIGYAFDKNAIYYEYPEIYGSLIYAYQLYNAGIDQYIYTNSLDQIYIDQGYEYDGILAQLYNAPINDAIPFYIYYNEETSKYEYKMDWYEYQFEQNGFKIQGILGYIFSEQQEESYCPLAKFYNQLTDKFYYECSEDAQAQEGYEYVQTDGYAIEYISQDEAEEQEEDLQIEEDFSFQEVNFLVTPFYRYYNKYVNDYFLTQNYFQYMKGQQGYEYEGFEGWILVEPSQDVETVPLYRYYNFEEQHHYYTIDINELGPDGNDYYQYDTIEGYVFETEMFEGLVPLYEFYNEDLSTYLYSQNQEEVSEAQGFIQTRIVCYLFVKDALPIIFPEITAYPNPILRYYNELTQAHLLTDNFEEYGYEYGGYVFEVVVGYGMPYPLYDSYPLYGYINQYDSEKRYYTTNWEEFQEQNDEYFFDRVIMYIFKEQQESTIPLFRFFNSELGDQLFTTDENEELEGYEFEGIEGYVYSNQ